MNLLLEGDDLEALLLRAHREGGTAARIVRAEKVRRGGVLGFFTKEGFQVAVEIPAEAVPADSAGAADSAGYAVTATAAGATEPVATVDVRVADLEHASDAAIAAALLEMVGNDGPRGRSRGAGPARPTLPALASGGRGPDQRTATGGRPGSGRPAIRRVAPGSGRSIDSIDLGTITASDPALTLVTMAEKAGATERAAALAVARQAAYEATMRAVMQAAEAEPDEPEPAQPPARSEPPVRAETPSHPERPVGAEAPSRAEPPRLPEPPARRPAFPKPEFPAERPWPGQAGVLGALRPAWPGRSSKLNEAAPSADLPGVDDRAAPAAEQSAVDPSMPNQDEPNQDDQIMDGGNPAARTRAGRTKRESGDGLWFDTEPAVIRGPEPIDADPAEMEQAEPEPIYADPVDPNPAVPEPIDAAPPTLMQQLRSGARLGRHRGDPPASATEPRSDAPAPPVEPAEPAEPATPSPASHQELTMTGGLPPDGSGTARATTVVPRNRPRRTGRSLPAPRLTGETSDPGQSRDESWDQSREQSRNQVTGTADQANGRPSPPRTAAPAGSGDAVADPTEAVVWVGPADPADPTSRTSRTDRTDRAPSQARQSWAEPTADPASAPGHAGPADWSLDQADEDRPTGSGVGIGIGSGDELEPGDDDESAGRRTSSDAAWRLLRGWRPGARRRNAGDEDAHWQQVRDESQEWTPEDVEPVLEPAAASVAFSQAATQGAVPAGSTVIGTRDQLAADREALRSLGVPAAWTDDLTAGDRFTSIVGMLAHLPEPRIAEDAAVIAVVGPADVVELEAHRTALDLPSAGRPRAVTLVPGQTGVDRRAAIARSKRVRPVVVSVPIDGYDDPAGTRVLLTNVKAEAVIAVIDAARPLAEISAWIEALGPVDAIALDGALDVGTPAAVLGLDVPVIRVDGISVDRIGWAALLCAQLSALESAR